MKKHILLFLVIGLFSIANVNAQAFKKGSINVDIGIGLGIYGTSQAHTYDRTVSIDTALVNSGFIKADGLDSKRTWDTTDGAAATIIPISIEYGLSNKFGVGLDVAFNNYFINDSDKVNLESVKSFDIGPKVSYHPLNSDFYDLSLGLGVGFTKIGWNTASTNTASSYDGSGIYLNIDIKNRFWFSDHLGAYANIGYKGNFYSSIDRDTSNEEANLEKNTFINDAKIKDEFNFKMNGVNFGIGLAVKF